MTGLAHDRGLFVPDSIPSVTKEELESWRSLSYSDLAVKVISKFVKDDQVPADKLDDIIKRSCGAFRHEDVTPVVKVGGHAILVSVVSVCAFWHAERKQILTPHRYEFKGTFSWANICI